MSAIAFSVFQFVPPDHTTKPRRQSHFRAYQAAIDARIAQAEGGMVRFHLTLKDKETLQDLEYVKLTDGREIRYPEEDEKRLHAAREWVRTGKGQPPALPRED